MNSLFDDLPNCDNGGIDYEADSPDAVEQGGILSTSTLGRVAELANLQIELENAVIKAEAELKAAKKKLYKVQCEDVPTLLEELGLSQVKLLDGSSVSVKENMYASIPKKNKKECATWLEAHELGELVSSELSLRFAKGEQEELAAAIDVLSDSGFEDVEVVESMNTASIKSAIKKMLEAGQEVPLKLFGVTIVKEAKISRAG